MEIIEASGLLVRFGFWFEDFCGPDGLGHTPKQVSRQQAVWVTTSLKRSWLGRECEFFCA